jgi:photosystem I reaction center subunit XII
MLNDNQIFIALVIALISGFLAIKLGVELYQD